MSNANVTRCPHGIDLRFAGVCPFCADPDAVLPERSQAETGAERPLFWVGPLAELMNEPERSQLIELVARAEMARCAARSFSAADLRHALTQLCRGRG